MSGSGPFNYPSTEEEALHEAVKRLGTSARVHRNELDFRAPCRITAIRYVGHGTKRIVVARGMTWERAIFSLDKRQVREQRRKPGKRKRKSRATVFPQEQLAL